MATATKTQQPTPDARVAGEIPKVSPRLVYWFDWYLQRYVPKHFHAFAISNAVSVKSIAASDPLIVYMNHASWWDPLVALIVAKRFFPKRNLHAPIDANAVQKYPFMQRLGFFPVEQNRLHGAGAFLKTARTILQHQNTSVWLTPEGRFADPREKDLPLQPGLAHLIAKLPRGVVLPLAVEYPFWEERLPEMLARFGQPMRIEDHPELSKAAWGHQLTSALRDTQRQLEVASLARDSSEFDVILAGQSGVNWIYDIFRRASSVLTGKKLARTHGDKLQ